MPIYPLLYSFNPITTDGEYALTPDMLTGIVSGSTLSLNTIYIIDRDTISSEIKRDNANKTSIKTELWGDYHREDPPNRLNIIRFIRMFWNSDTNSLTGTREIVDINKNKITGTISYIYQGNIYMINASLFLDADRFTADNLWLIDETPEPELTSLEITQMPYKTIYNVGEIFVLDGLEVEGIYSDNTRLSLDYVRVSGAQNIGYITTPADGYEVVNPGGDNNKTCYISSSSGLGNTSIQTSFEYTVSDNIINNNPQLYQLRLDSSPDKLIYLPGEIIDITGLHVTAVYNDSNAPLRQINYVSDRTGDSGPGYYISGYQDRDFIPGQIIFGLSGNNTLYIRPTQNYNSDAQLTLTYTYNEDNMPENINNPGGITDAEWQNEYPETNREWAIGTTPAKGLIKPIMFYYGPLTTELMTRYKNINRVMNTHVNVNLDAVKKIKITDKLKIKDSVSGITLYDYVQQIIAHNEVLSEKAAFAMLVYQYSVNDIYKIQYWGMLTDTDTYTIYSVQPNGLHLTDILSGSDIASMTFGDNTAILLSIAAGALYFLR